MIAITRWEFQHPREALRVVAVAMEALHRLGVANPARNFIVVSEGLSTKTAFRWSCWRKKTAIHPEEEACGHRAFRSLLETSCSLSALASRPKSVF